jgi:predicted GTPase
MEIGRYDYDNVTLYDSPGFGDTKEKDKLHAEKVTKTLKKKNKDGSQLIDFVLVIVDGSSKDLGTSFDVINKVILPNIGLDKDRILVAINQADMAMKGTYWNPATNRPEPELEAFLDMKIASVKTRIEEATGVVIEPIYYAAGYTDPKSGKQNPSYNLSKLLLYILKAVKEEKRMAIAQDLNEEKKSWQADDGRSNYKKEIKETLWQAVVHDCKQLGESAKKLVKAGWEKVKGWF